MKNFIRKIFCSIILILVMAVALISCGLKNSQDIVSEGLGLNVSDAEEISVSDTYGGSHGDGITCIVLEVEGELVQTVLTQITRLTKERPRLKIVVRFGLR